MARNENGKGFSLKDELFNKEKVQWLAAQFKVSDPQFADKQFVREVMAKLTELELKERIVHIATVLEKFLPADFAQAATQLKAALPPALDPTKTDNDFGDFMLAPLGEYVVRNGLSKKHLKRSLGLLKELTKRFSMEDAIRYFIRAFPDETLTALKNWAQDENYHVRRLVSEGTRPLLPWSGRIQLEHKVVIPLLDQLYADKTRYVTRSVANHLNDISKLDPELAVRTIKRWRKSGTQVLSEIDWMTRHGLRTLLKQGHPEALALLGYHPAPRISVSKVLRQPAKLSPGTHLEFSFTITATDAAVLLVDYIVAFQKARGKIREKVFKLKTVRLKAGESVTVQKRHLFVKDPTTLRYYPGTHTLTIQINGKQYEYASFMLQL